MTRAQHLIDIETLPAMELREKYPTEANTHRNMKVRAQQRGKEIHPEFEEFASFLAHVGPKPFPDATLDRIDNNDPEYGPGKVRWADRYTQNNNKSDNLLFTSSSGGRTYSALELSHAHGITVDAIRKRKERGWSDDDIIANRRLGVVPNFAALNDPELYDFRPWLVPTEEQLFQEQKARQQAPIQFAIQFYATRLKDLSERIENVEADAAEEDADPAMQVKLARLKATGRLAYSRYQHYLGIYEAWKRAWQLRRPVEADDDE